METSGLSGGMMPGMASGILGLEIPLHHPQRQHQQLYQNQHQHQIVSFTSHEANQQSQQSMKQQNTYSNSGNKGKQQQQQVLSDEEEPGCTGDDAIGGEARKRVSPWQRVKWSDNMIRLLIMVVFYIEDDGGNGGQEGSNDQSGGGNKKKSGGGLLQKKGKWKSVSKAMMDKGFFVSPQQCEDKFNDLNKRYKRVNEILGKGTACRVVENQSLLDTMDQLSPKMKEEARKLLNSKHLFFREMCAYHNSGGTAVHQSSEAAIEPSHYQQPQHCHHLANGGGGVSNSRSKVEVEGSRMVKWGSRGEEDDEEGENSGEGDDEDDEDEDYDDDDDEEINGHDDEDENERFSSKKRQRKGVSSSSLPSSTMPLFQQFSCELMSVIQDGSKSPLEQRQWMRSRWMQLEEQQVSFRTQAYELEKQRLKWVKFSTKKEKEMERMKLNNERMRLENERMVLLLRQKEFELLDFQRQQDCPKRAEPSSITG